MRYSKELNHAARALQVAQRCVAESVFSEVTNRLRNEPCVAFALTCDGFVDWSPEVDIAVRMLSIARYGRPVDHGHLIRGLEPHWVTSAAIESGLKAVAACIPLFSIPVSHLNSRHTLKDNFRSTSTAVPVTRTRDCGNSLMPSRMKSAPCPSVRRTFEMTQMQSTSANPGSC